MKILLLSILTFLMFNSFGQSAGDTVVVQSFDYTMTTGSSGGLARSMVVPFPDNTLTYSKILMLYNMRCRDGAVNTSGGNYVACGEWDYSCNTYIHDSTRVDSFISSTNSHSISGFSGTTYNYSSSPIFNYIQSIQQLVTLNNIVSESQSTVGVGTNSLSNVFPSNSENGKSMYLFTEIELTAAGLTSGDIDALLFNVLNTAGDSDYLRVRVKASTKIELDDTDPDLGTFTEVYYHNTTFSNGQNRLQFHTPYNWDGISNLIVEFSFTNPDNTTQIEIEGTTMTNVMGMHTSGDRYFNFNGSNYIESDNYKGIDGSQARTIEAWINSSVTGKELTGWGVNATNQKWVIRINGDGTIRAEVNGGYKYGTTVVSDANWHHIAIVLNGSNITNASLYVDGVLEGTGASQSAAVNTNTTTGMNLRIANGPNNSFFNGMIDEYRVWSTALSATDIYNWRYKSIDASHPNYSNLETYFSMNEGSGTSINDQTSYARNATVLNGENWSRPKGVELFKEFVETNERPNIVFAQGVYNLTILNDTLLDSIVLPSNLVKEFQISSNAGTVMNDDIITVSTNNYWEANYQYLYNEDGVKLDSMVVVPDGSITVSTLNYQRRLPMRFEIISFVTPYGINLDLGMEGKTWQIDLTDYTPVLKGDKLMTIERGGQWNEDLDIKFLFIVGTPPRDVKDVQQIWRNDSKGYTSIIANTSFEPRDVMMDATATSYKLKSAITGHGQEGEFIPRDHFFNIDGGANEFNWQVWTECANNPVYPQGGTWVYDRAGWCPGEPTYIYEYDLSPFVTPGQIHSIDYGLVTASGNSNYIVNNQLVSYGPANFQNDAAVVDIKDPSKYVEYERFNSICANPTVVIQNTGSNTLTSLTINYWVNGSSNPESYNWTGSLEFMETAEVDLPSPTTLWTTANSVNNKFHVEVSNPNSLADEYAHNNTYESEFDLVAVLPTHFFFYFKTNNFPNENKYELFDDQGTVLFTRNGMSANTIYRDTFKLHTGCYSLVVTDTDGDGISWWANNDGNGAAYLRQVSGGLIKVLEPDFGNSIIYNFSVNTPLSYDDLFDSYAIEVYPNPASSNFMVKAGSIAESEIKIYNSLGQEVQIPFKSSIDQLTFDSKSLDPGIYYISIDYRGEKQTKKLIIE